MRRSLLDSPSSRRAGLTPELGIDGPSLAEVMALAGHGLSSGDQARGKATVETLARTGITYSGATYGFALKPEMADSVWDKARLLDGPFARIRWGTTRFKEFILPIYNESSRLNGARWGGMKGQVGLSETTNWTPLGTGPVLATANFAMCRLDVFSMPISRDLLADSALVAPMLDYTAKSEIRFLVDQALINGNSISQNTGVTVRAPSGVLGSPSTVAVQRAGSNAIAAADLDGMWSAIAGPNKRGACWHASDEVIQKIDAAALTGGWVESIYIPAGKYGNIYATVKGRPLIPCEACPALGTPGDICVVDWGDYAMYVQATPVGSSLSFNIAQPVDGGHQGSWGLPTGSVESRMSDEFLFSNDEVVFHWVSRMDGHFVWTGPVRNANGALTGPAAILTA